MSPGYNIKELFYTCNGAPSKSNFVGKMLLVELVTIIVSYFSNYIVIVVRNVIKVSLKWLLFTRVSNYIIF